MLMALTALAFLSPGQGQKPAGDFAFRLEYGVCTTDVLDTFQRVFVRDSGSRAPPVSITLMFPPESLHAAFRAVVAVDFFKYPSYARAVIGGEGGIRTLPAPLGSISYRGYVAASAVKAVNAVGHCPPLPAEPAIAMLYRCDMEDERGFTVELESDSGGEEISSVRVAPDDLAPDTLRAVVESFVLREGTDYGIHEVSLEAKVEQVLVQLRRGEAHITFDPATESVNVVVTSAIGGSGSPGGVRRFDADR